MQTDTGNLPAWPSASAVYSKAYRVLERMAERGHVRKSWRQCFVSDDMTRLIDALHAGDEETIKGLLLMDWVYPQA